MAHTEIESVALVSSAPCSEKPTLKTLFCQDFQCGSDSQEPKQEIAHENCRSKLFQLLKFMVRVFFGFLIEIAPFLT